MDNGQVEWDNGQLCNSEKVDLSAEFNCFRLSSSYPIEDTFMLQYQKTKILRIQSLTKKVHCPIKIMLKISTNTFKRK